MNNAFDPLETPGPMPTTSKICQERKAYTKDEICGREYPADRECPLHPRKRGNPWLLVGAIAVIGVTSFVAGHLIGQPKQAISSDDALAYLNAQVKMNEIGLEFNKKIKPLQDKAEADAMPYRKTLGEIQKRVCKANAMADDCEIDALAKTVKAKAKAGPGSAPGH